MNKLDLEIIENLHEQVHTIKQNNLLCDFKFKTYLKYFCLYKLVV